MGNLPTLVGLLYDPEIAQEALGPPSMSRRYHWCHLPLPQPTLGGAGRSRALGIPSLPFPLSFP